MLEYIYSGIALLIAITIHEFSHAFVADKLGDPTPRVNGRLSLNPLKHLDILGTIMIFFIHFGWGKPVPIDTKYFKKPLPYAALTAIIGPISNFILAIIFISITKYSINFLPNTLKDLFIIIALINIYLGVFNLLPFPPLDGSHILELFIPKKYKNSYDHFLETGYIYLIIFIAFDFLLLSKWTGFSILGTLMDFIAKYIFAFFSLGA